jgi:hypothetical protein
MPVAATQWECRTTGSNSNGGGYSSGGVDYSQQNAAQLTVTDAAATSTTNLSSATGGFTSNMIGNVVNVVGQGRRTITAFVNTNNVTCNAAWGTFSSATANVGGALLDVETVLAVSGGAVAGNIIWIASGTYTLTVTRTIAASGSSTNPIEIIGYNSTRTRTNLTEANMPIFTSATNSVAIFTSNGSLWLSVRNIKVTHTAATRGNGWANVTAGSRNYIWSNCIIDGCLNGWRGGSSFDLALYNCKWINCTARNCTGTGATSGGFCDLYTVAHVNVWHGCYSHDNAGSGFAVHGGGEAALVMINCIADTNTQSGFYDNADAAFLSSTWFNCVSYGNTQHGFRSQLNSSNGAAAFAGAVNCIAANNTQYGFSCATTAIINNGNSLLGARNSATYNNSAGAYQNWATPEGAITLTADPFTSAAAGDFSLNSTAGGGAALRELAFPATIGLTSNYASVGAAEPQATGGGGSTRGYIIGG